MDGFAKYLVQRLFQFFLVIFLGVSLAFLITNLSPVDPVEQSVALMTSFGATDPRAVEMMREALAELYGLQGTVLLRRAGARKHPRGLARGAAQAVHVIEYGLGHGSSWPD